MPSSISHDAGRLKLDPDLNKTAAAEQRITIAAADRARRHYLKFDVIGAPGDAIDLLLGITSGGEQVLRGLYIAGQHIVPFDPPAGSGNVNIYLRFAKSGGWPVWIDNVSFLDDEPLELATPWVEDDLARLTYDQSHDVMTICEAGVHTRDLARTDLDGFSLELFPNTDGPYLDENIEDHVTLYPAAVSGERNRVVASFDLFQATDLYRPLTIRHIDEDAQGVWGWGIIREVTDGKNVFVETRRNFGRAGDNANGKVPSWRLGAWTASVGYPSAVVYHDGRQIFAGGNHVLLARRVDGSAQPGFTRYTPGAAGPADAWTHDTAVRGRIRHLVSAGQLLALSTNQVRAMSGDGKSQPILATAFADSLAALTGVSFPRPLSLGAQVITVSRDAKRLIALEYSDFEGSYDETNLSLLVEHLTQQGLVDTSFTTTPWPEIYAVREDGSMLVMLYLPEENVQGWSRFEHANALPIEAIATRVGPDGDELWMVVGHQVGGETRRYIERLETPQRGDAEWIHNYYVDAGVSAYGTRNADITLAARFGSNVLVTSNPGVWVAGDVGRQIVSLFRTATDQFGIAGSALARATITAVESSGSWYLTQTEVAGLAHLEGETVAVYGDGRKQGLRVVNQGRVKVDPPAGVVHAGLDYSWTWRTMPLELPSRQGTAQSKPTQIARVVGRFVRTQQVSAQLIRSDRQLPAVLQRPPVPADVLESTPVWSGDIDLLVNSDWQRSAILELSGDDGPATCLMLVPHANVGEVL